MERKNNYTIQAEHARRLFTQYDPEALARKLHTVRDRDYLYTGMIGERYRIRLEDGWIERWRIDRWIPADSFDETMTLLDLVCDCAENRHPDGTWKDLRDFGLQFHRSLLEDSSDPWAVRFQSAPERFCYACRALGGEPFDKGDAAFVIPFFDTLPVLIQLWYGDEEFPPRLRWLWDSNASMYIRYETMHYAVGLLKNRLSEYMGDI